MKINKNKYLEVKQELKEVFSKFIDLCVIYIKDDSSELNLHFVITGKEQSLARFYNLLQRNPVLNDILSKPGIKLNSNQNKILNEMTCNIKAQSKMELEAKLGYIKLLF